jgi:sugar phosphate isomerase/epimerase
VAKSADRRLLGDPEVVLCSLSMVPIGFLDLVEFAVAGGFDGISVGPPVYKRARRDENLGLQEMRRIIDDSGLFVSEVEVVANWLTSVDDKPARWSQKTSDEEYIELAGALGARSVLATHFGSPRPTEEAAKGFAALCDRAAADRLAVALEFPAFATVSDVGEAWEIVRLAHRPNGGLLIDTWHYYRGGGDERSLRSVDADRIFGIQLADADPEPVGSLEDDILYRRLPGEGSLDLASLVGILDGMGVRAPIGIEVWDERLLAEGRQTAARRLGAATRRFLEACAEAGERQPDPDDPGPTPAGTGF